MSPAAFDEVEDLPTRSPPFLDRLEQDPALWSGLSEAETLACLLGVRDLYFARGRGDPLVRTLLEIVDVAPVLEIQGLAASFHPSSRLRSSRHIDADEIDPAWRLFCARPSLELPNLVTVFVDPQEFSFRSYENIVPLDALFEGIEPELALNDRRALYDDEVEIYSFATSASAQLLEVLNGLDTLGLYLPPLNSSSRGGKRLIFHSALLSEAWTAAIRAALPDLPAGFSHVNPVFRLNRFAPGEEFRSHMDTPYYDAARDHVSKYTVVLYLSAGRGSPALRIEDLHLEAIEALTCVVFPQDYEHEGRAFDSGDKVFLRTELVFEDATVTHDPGIAALFSKACYMTGESLFDDELAAHMHDCYDRVAAAHWRGLEQRSTDGEPFVHKEFRGFHFLANGYEFWFPKGPLSLKECAALTVLDYFNCKIGGAAFRSLCSTDVVPGATGRAWIASFFANQPPAPPDPLFQRLNSDALFPPPERANRSECCPAHGREPFDASRNSQILDLYSRAQNFSRSRITAAPVVIMGEALFLDPDAFLVEGDKLYLKSDRALTPVNFAGCWNGYTTPDDYVIVEATVEAPRFLLPPVLFSETETLYRLRFDFFRNSWLVDFRPQSVPVPRVERIQRNEVQDGGEEWLVAVDPTSLSSDVTSKKAPWWRRSPLIHELFAEGEDPVDP